MTVKWRRCVKLTFISFCSFIFVISVQRRSVVTPSHDNWKEVQKDRLSLMEQQCQLLQQENAWQEKRRFLSGYVVDKSSGLAYCHIPKVASTWWLKLFAKRMLSESDLSDLKSNSSAGLLHNLMLRNTSLPLQLEDNFKFVFVRHPLSRLVSAYVSKVIHNNGEKKILETLIRFAKRRSIEPLTAPTVELNFPLFVDFVMDELERDLVSFGTFHWLPYYRLCELCNVRIDMVGKLETMEADVRYLVKRFPMLADLAELTSKENAAGTTHAVNQKYLKQLSEKTRARLCRLYEPDFRLFGYTCHDL